MKKSTATLMTPQSKMPLGGIVVSPVPKLLRDLPSEPMSNKRKEMLEEDLKNFRKFFPEE
jgi:hypothetical protein